MLRHLCERFPSADLYTLFHEPGSVPTEIEDRRIFVSPLNRMPWRTRHYRKLLPLFPWAIRRFDFSDYDLVLSTSHAVAKSVRTPRGVAHVDYCFTPMRYVWDQVEAYLGTGLRRSLAQPLVRGLRQFDVRTSRKQDVTRFVAISSDVADRIARHYGREARVVPPPVDISWIEVAQQPPEDFYLLVGSFVPYKREELAIDAFRNLDRTLVIVGEGPSRARLAQNLPRNIKMVGHVDDTTLASLYRRCRALIYPQHEDFGLVAVEAQAAGRPVIAYCAGGVLDTVRPFKEQGVEAASYEATGVFFDEQTPKSLCRAVERFEKIQERFLPLTLRRWAERFSPQAFDTAMDLEIAAALGDCKPLRGEKLQ